jgi:hypothetical protein
MGLIWAIFSWLLVSQLAFAAGPDSHYCDASARCKDYYEAFDFLPLDSLDPRAADLILRSGTDYETWVGTHDSEAAAFLALARALTAMEVKVSAKQWVPFIALIKQVNDYEGDRTYFMLDGALFDRWRNENKGEFRIAGADGKKESGRFRFEQGSLSGSLHRNYDISASTSIKDVPRIQINYRFKDSEADIDLDGFSPWKWGIIPNPHHLTYKNSDVRQWFQKFLKKFGDPGFRVRPH